MATEKRVARLIACSCIGYRDKCQSTAQAIDPTGLGAGAPMGRGAERD
jgi:hypothetical protein